MRDTKYTNKSYGKKPYANRIDIMGDEVRPTFKATCDNCGKTCELPFKPTNGKPVYCNNCFSSMKDSPSGMDRRSNRKVYNKSGYESKEMFSAVCDDCGKTCEVPFKPTNSKPIYCSDCFEKRGNVSQNNRNRNDNSNVLAEQLDAINTKLDKLIQLLTPQEK